MPTNAPTNNTAILNARLNAANRALAKQLATKHQAKGLDAFDKFLINATKLGLFALFGVFVAAKAQERYNKKNLAQNLTPSIRPTMTP